MTIDIDEPERFILEINGSLAFDQKIDAFGWFTGFSDGERADYNRFATENKNDYETWELPFGYIATTVWENVYVEGELTRAAAPARVDVHEVDVSIIKRPGQPSFTKPKVTPEDFDALLERVSWLKTLHRTLDGLSDEPTAEELADLARIPGPLDTPLLNLQKD